MSKNIRWLIFLLVLLLARTIQPTASQGVGEHEVFLPLVMRQQATEVLGLSGGRIIAVAVAPSNPQRVYAGSWGGGVYRSDDFGASWTRANAGLGSLQIWSLAVHPQNPDLIYAGTHKYGVYKSTNGGLDWSPTAGGLNREPIVYSIAINPANPNELYIGTRSPNPPTSWWEGNVYKSVDGGASWSKPLNGVNIGDGYIYGVAIDPNNPSTVYAASHNNGLWRTTNSHASWARVSSLAEIQTRKVRVDPTSSNRVFVSGEQGSSNFYRTTNATASWSNVSPSFDTQTLWEIAIHPVTSSTVYVASLNNGLFKSTNSGDSWSKPWTGSDEIYGLALDPDTPATLYVGTGLRGLFKSVDSAASWFQSQDGLNAANVSSLLVDPDTPTTLYGALYGDGVRKSTDEGASWTAINNGLGDLFVHALLMAADNNQEIYSATENGVYKSLDGGSTWGESSAGLPSLSFAETLVPPAFNHLQAEDWLQDELYLDFPVDPARSLEGPQATSLTGVRALAARPGAPDTIYAGTTGNGVYRSANAGATWSGSGLSSRTVYALAIDPAAPDRMFAGVNSSFYRSTNAGASWTERRSGLGSNTVYAVLIDGSQPGRVYAGTSDGIFVSNNNGDSWSQVGLDGQTVYALGQRTTPNMVLYAGSENGFYVSYDAGGSWLQRNNDLSDRHVQAISVDLNRARIYLGTQAGGAYRWNTLQP